MEEDGEEKEEAKSVNDSSIVEARSHSEGRRKEAVERKLTERNIFSGKWKGKFE